MSDLQNPDEFYRKFSNDSLYRDLIFALYGFSVLCFLWAAWGLSGYLRSMDWKSTTAHYQQPPGNHSGWQVLCFSNESEMIPVTRLYFGGNPPPLGIGAEPVPTPATVYYNPKKPEDNVVYRHPSWMTWLLILVGTFLLALIPRLKSAIAV